MSYSIVKLEGGPADGEIVQVHDDVRRIRVCPVQPPRITPPAIRFRALSPIYIYHRDTNYPEHAIYAGREEDL